MCIDMSWRQCVRLGECVYTLFLICHTTAETPTRYLPNTVSRCVPASTCIKTSIVGQRWL